MRPKRDGEMVRVYTVRRVNTVERADVEGRGNVLERGEGRVVAGEMGLYNRHRLSR